MEQKPPTAAIAAANRAHIASLPFADTRDFDDADRGFIAALEPCVVTAADGRVVWDNDSYNWARRSQLLESMLESRRATPERWLDLYNGEWAGDLTKIFAAARM